jgi:hypothetical protein
MLAGRQNDSVMMLGASCQFAFDAYARLKLANFHGLTTGDVVQREQKTGQ